MSAGETSLPSALALSLSAWMTFRLRVRSLKSVAVGLGEEAGKEIDLDDTALGVGTAGVGDGAEHVVSHVARSVAERAGRGVGCDDRRAADDEGAEEGAIGDVGDVDHHAQAIHLIDNIFAEFGEALFGVGHGLVVDVAGAVGPTVGVGPGEGHVADAEGIVLAQQGNRVFDGVTALNAHEHCEFVRAVRVLNAVGRGDKHELVRVLSDLLLDGVNEFEGSAGVLAFIEGGLDPDGEELGAEVAFARGFEVEVATVEWAGEVEALIEESLRGVGVGINHQGRPLNACGGFGLRSGLVHRGYRGLSGEQNRKREKHDDGQRVGTHRHLMSLYPKRGTPNLKF